MKKLIQISLLTLMFAIILQSCKKEDVINPTTGNGIITGKVIDQSGAPLSGVSVSSGGASGITDGAGSYKLEKVSKGEAVIVRFKKDNYNRTTKVTAVQDYHTSRADAALYMIGKTAVVSSSTGGTVQTNGAEVIFPTSGFKDMNGNAVTGDVTVELTYFNPVDEHFCEAFPGNFDGIRENGSETSIESFGFINVDLKNSAGDKVNLANGKTATIKVNVPAKISGKAPATIPLWHFDEAKGRWVEDGQATLNGSTYVGTVTHFTSWNCDQPTQTSYLKGRVVDEDGNPLKHAWVVSKGYDYIGSSSAYSSVDEEGGYFKIPVKADATAEVWAIYSGFASAKATFTTPPAGQEKQIGNIVIKVEAETPKNGWYKIIPPVNDYIYDIKFINDEVGFVLSNDLFKTTDGGASWTLAYDIPQNGKDSMMVNSIDIVSANVIYLNASPLAKSTDGGETWQVLDYFNTQYIRASDFISETKGYVITDKLYVTNDGGVNWTPVGSNINIYPVSFYAFDNNRLIMQSWQGLMVSVDGGATWASSAFPPQKDYGKIYAFAFDRIYFFGERGSGLYLTSDNGLTWTYLSDEMIQNLYFVDDINGWAAAGQNRILRTKNGGYTWEEQYKADSLIYIDKVYMVNQLRGYASGYGGMLLKTDNGGEK